MFKKITIVLLSSLALFGCGGEEVVVPDAYQGKAASYSYPDEDVKFYDKNGLMAVNVIAYADSALSQEQRIATAIEVARKWEDNTSSKLVFVTLWDPNMLKAGYLAKADLYVDKCGIDGKQCDGIQWRISGSTTTPKKLDKEVYKLWWANRNNYQTADGTTDNDLLKTAISEHLSITPKQVSLFFYDNWTIEKEF